MKENKPAEVLPWWMPNQSGISPSELSPSPSRLSPSGLSLSARRSVRSDFTPPEQTSLSEPLYSPARPAGSVPKHVASAAPHFTSYSHHAPPLFAPISGEPIQVKPLGGARLARPPGTYPHSAPIPGREFELKSPGETHFLSSKLKAGNPERRRSGPMLAGVPTTACYDHRRHSNIISNLMQNQRPYLQSQSSLASSSESSSANFTSVSKTDEVGSIKSSHSGSRRSSCSDLKSVSTESSSSSSAKKVQPTATDLICNPGLLGGWCCPQNRRPTTERYEVIAEPAAEAQKRKVPKHFFVPPQFDKQEYHRFPSKPMQLQVAIAGNYCNIDEMDTSAGMTKQQIADSVLVQQSFQAREYYGSAQVMEAGRKSAGSQNAVGFGTEKYIAKQKQKPQTFLKQAKTYFGVAPIEYQTKAVGDIYDGRYKTSPKQAAQLWDHSYNRNACPAAFPKIPVSQTTRPQKSASSHPLYQAMMNSARRSPFPPGAASSSAVSPNLAASNVESPAVIPRETAEQAPYYTSLKFGSAKTAPLAAATSVEPRSAVHSPSGRTGDSDGFRAFSFTKEEIATKRVGRVPSVKLAWSQSSSSPSPCL